RQSPRIEVEHGVGKEPEIERAHTLRCVRMISRKIKRRLAWLRDPQLQVPPTESLSPVAGVVQLLSEPRVHVRDVELFEIVVAVERPVGVYQIIHRRSRIAAELVEWHPRH